MMRRLLRVVLTYSLWLVAAVMALGIMLGMRTLILMDLPVRLGMVDRWVLRGIDKIGMVILGILWLVFVIVPESYFRRFLKKELSVIEVAKFFGVEILVLGAVYGGLLLI